MEADTRELSRHRKEVLIKPAGAPSMTKTPCAPDPDETAPARRSALQAVRAAPTRSPPRRKGTTLPSGGLGVDCREEGREREGSVGRLHPSLDQILRAGPLPP